jgi:hypothetical protein
MNGSSRELSEPDRARCDQRRYERIIQRPTLMEPVEPIG